MLAAHDPLSVLGILLQVGLTMGPTRPMRGVLDVLRDQLPSDRLMARDELRRETALPDDEFKRQLDALLFDNVVN